MDVEGKQKEQETDNKQLIGGGGAKKNQKILKKSK